MLLPMDAAHGVADGSVTLAFRRWRRPDVAPGATLRTVAGVVRVDEVSQVDPAAISDEDARRAGHPDADRLRARLRGDAGLTTYRIELSWVGEDPRVALREDDRLTDQDVADLDARLARLDRASRHGSWTTATLELIGRRPHVRAVDLAAELGRERDPFKLDVRKLKSLGLTRCHEIGYELSPRGRAFLARRAIG